MAWVNRSQRQTFCVNTLERPGNVEDVADVVDRLTSNLQQSINSYMLVTSENQRKNPDPEFANALKQTCTDSLQDVKTLLYRVIAQKRALEADLWTERKRRRELEKSVRGEQVEEEVGSSVVNAVEEVN